MLDDRNHSSLEPVVMDWRRRAVTGDSGVGWYRQTGTGIDTGTGPDDNHRPRHSTVPDGISRGTRTATGELVHRGAAPVSGGYRVLEIGRTGVLANDEFGSVHPAPVNEAEWVTW